MRNSRGGVCGYLNPRRHMSSAGRVHQHVENRMVVCNHMEFWCGRSHVARLSAMEQRSQGREISLSHAQTLCKRVPCSRQEQCIHGGGWEHAGDARICMSTGREKNMGFFFSAGARLMWTEDEVATKRREGVSLFRETCCVVCLHSLIFWVEGWRRIICSS